LFNSRHLRSSSLRRDTLLANRVAWGAAVILLWLQITYVYAPFMHTLFGSASLSPLLWAIPVGIGMVMFLLVELEKKLVARNLGDGR
ncbi:MAG: cation transporting ATPase C-terminal domain-containing protein, partial [Desulfobulbus sp.]|nr:cation transporting ATPase C-terminal domain-containing protein [Desulfobulbus sp.]